MTERRFAPASGLEVELGVAPPWAATGPVDEGTLRIVDDRHTDGDDPKGILARLLDACGRLEAADGSGGSGVGRA